MTIDELVTEARRCGCTVAVKSRNVVITHRVVSDILIVPNRSPVKQVYVDRFNDLLAQIP